MSIKTNINTERVKAIRNELKAAFPDVKFSVRRHHHSSVEIAVMKSPYNWGETRNVNPYYLNLQGNPEFIEKVYSIANAGNRTVSHDGDYGDIPKFYVNIEIGKWDQPHIQVGDAPESDPLPAAACPRCGGWTRSGGMSQHANATEKVHGRIGCRCYGGNQ